MSPAVARIDVAIDDRQQGVPIESGRFADLLERALVFQLRDRLSDAGAEVGLAFVDAQEMTTLNVQYMNGSGPTDVLAFPIDGVEDGGVPADQPIMLGDIVVCPEVAALAPQDLVDELALLVVHGALHLLGHDHAEPEETAVMKQLEAQLLDRFHTS